MEQNLPIITKKLWNMVRLAFLMLRKGITKKKILLDINMMMKRGKIASKVALNSLIFHHYLHHYASPSRRVVPEQPSHLQPSPSTPQDYAFSCSNTPVHLHHCTSKRKNQHYQHQKYYYVPSPSKQSGVGQLRITDSPYPLQNEDDSDHHVDQAAENFIKRFYSQLKEQNWE